MRSADSRTPALDNSSAYYQHTKSVPFASRISQRMRAQMYGLFAERFRPAPNLRVLDVGVTSDATHAESNYFEKMYPFPSQLTCVGTEDGSHLMAHYPGLLYQKVTPGAPLPFADREFDVVFSNAVLEHVGNRHQQADFIRELLRVGRTFFITTPNRWFPVEHHTGLPLLHYLPSNLYRACLSRTKYRYWSDEAHLNMLTAKSLRSLFPADTPVQIHEVRFCGIGSNLVALHR